MTRFVSSCSYLVCCLSLFACGQSDLTLPEQTALQGSCGAGYPVGQSDGGDEMGFKVGLILPCMLGSRETWCKVYACKEHAHTRI